MPVGLQGVVADGIWFGAQGGMLIGDEEVVPPLHSQELAAPR